jgi:hypothetical protein
MKLLHRRPAPFAHHATMTAIARTAPMPSPRRILVVGVLIALANTATSLSAVAASSPPTVTLKTSPESVSPGASSTLTWSSTNATSCTASGDWSGTLATSGSRSTGALSAATAFTITCTGAGGTASRTDTVYLSSEMPQVTFTASPTRVQAGGNAVLTWKASNAYMCHGYGPWYVSEPVEGSSTTNGLTATTTFILTCFNASGAKTSEKATVTVIDAAAAGTATLSWNAPTSNVNGTPITPLKGYTIYYGNSAGSMTQSLVVSGAATTGAEITGLGSGTWYFGVSADATDGTQSAMSEIGSITL